MLKAVQIIIFSRRRTHVSTEQYKCREPYEGRGVGAWELGQFRTSGTDGTDRSHRGKGLDTKVGPGPVTVSGTRVPH